MGKNLKTPRRSASSSKGPIGHGAFSQREQDLIRRYLIWCYKTTKENLDRVDRYYTQIEVDYFVRRELIKKKSFESSPSDPRYTALIEDFEKYISDKKNNVNKKKFADDQCVTLDSDYRYLRDRMDAIEKAIVHFLGAEALEEIRLLYEEEMTRRILSSREHT
ncbi:MAG TPA: hypothetical protein DD723_04435 [Candidatus Omnitrophica bacterium]|nr:MAG: hypothetical protein A2Z81_03935 [Omnitrophica WOR_2 bacterium GWA2_45_18]OGX20361.1 MAG: hypothetical protein A2Y04_04990 [Omnitrophica WOR_2 bacterium GWC2_45_7]HBR14777.1 hypothetical protein [Candidatus Omnitrophota bacterium]